MALKILDTQWGRPFVEKGFSLRDQHSISTGMFNVRNDLENVLVVTATHKMFHKLSTVLFTYNRRLGVTNHPGHLNYGYTSKDVR